MSTGGSRKVYVSITGLKVKAWYYAPTFWYHAVSSMTQARSAAGNISAANLDNEGVHHTMSVWESRKHMIAYLYRGNHAKAIKVFDDIAIDGRTYGYETTFDQIPSWEKAIELYKEHSVEIGRKSSKGKKKTEASLATGNSTAEAIASS